MRPLPSSLQALQDLAFDLPHLLAIADQAFDAWQEREQLCADVHLPTGASISIRATDMYGMMVHFAKEHYNGLDSRPEAKLYNGIFGVVLADRYFVRFKKLDDALDVANHTSKQNDKYRSQLPFTDELTEDIIHLYLGYRPDDMFTRLEGVYLVCRLQDMVHWDLNLTTQKVEESLIIEFPNTVPAPEPRIRKAESSDKIPVRRVIPRKTGTDDLTPPASPQ